MPSTAIGLLVAWANQQDQWVRDVVAEVIAVRRGLSDGRIAEILDALLREKGLAEGAPPALVELIEPDAAESQYQALTLTTLSDVKNVNALATGQTIEFNAGMTVLFGENAAGKSGYVRIFKSAASVRGVEKVLPNIHHPGPPPQPSATIGFRLGDANGTVTWQGTPGVHPVTRVDVFDARAAVLHVDDDLTYSYTPSDLGLFPLVHNAIERTKVALETQRRKNAPSTNPFLQQFGRETSLYAIIEGLGAATDLTALEALAAVSEESERGIEMLRRNVEALGSRTPHDRVTVATNERDVYRHVRRAAETLLKFDVPGYNTSLQQIAQAHQRHTEATHSALANEAIPGVLGEQWAAFIRAGEQYLRAVEPAAYPEPGSSCAYCRQPLEETALSLLQKYRDYCNDSLAQEVERLQAAFQVAVAGPLSVDVARLKEELGQLAAAVPEGQTLPEVLVAAQLLNSAASDLQDALRTSRPSEQMGIPALAERVVALTGPQIQSLEEAITDLGRETAQRTELHAVELANLRLLEARIKLKALFPEVRGYVNAARWAENARAVLGRFQGLQRSLTEASKVASERLLNTDFERLFLSECAALRAPAVGLEFPGRKGEAARRKRLVPDHKLSEILSEGEQKVIALADFIAETALKPTSTPTVFDDPVNSLDYQRLRYVAMRLAELSAMRQIIVFTHNIWFAAELLSRFEKQTARCSYFDISDVPPARGLVSAGTHPRWDTVKATTGQINKLIQEAKTARRTGGDSQTVVNALVERAYSFLRNIIEVIVEQELFCGVAQRYSPHVAMTQLTKIRCDRLAAAISAVLPVFEKCCRITEAHSQPLETLGVRPTIEELEADWQAVLDARTAYIAK